MIPFEKQMKGVFHSMIIEILMIEIDSKKSQGCIRIPLRFFHEYGMKWKINKILEPLLFR
jgi:hypothetical protein